MQIVEVSDLAVRSAVIRLKRRDTPMTFVLYPMIHMGEAQFYRSVSRRLRTADVIVTEGVGDGTGRASVVVRALTLSYSVLRFNRRAGNLVQQEIDYDSLDATIVHPDATDEEFGHSWRRVPLRDRSTMFLVLPVVILLRLFGGTRLIWTRAAAEQNDLPSQQEEAIFDSHPELENAFLGDRDAMLLEALYRLHEERGTENIEVAVVYGAGHMPAVVHGLAARYGYRPRSADWLTIVSL
ncbi:hypothetical protein Ait01nite_046530 [Actinoplanes italicus]|uniref:TraB family protein n=1 Tax=Actinoplanes italicus TaxID=113567 RepID=A0A2T0K9E5_9ACTN|nr:hypothetical protein [Actinoplanes italicus]PRX19758.1 hypothetical protein CLV67_10923 [Actinoplanes italicus]GIE31608.1 hypothetical protein Ait01nite_046530 [Actinoplanes italicus]